MMPWLVLPRVLRLPFGRLHPCESLKIRGCKASSKSAHVAVLLHRPLWQVRCSHFQVSLRSHLPDRAQEKFAYMGETKVHPIRCKGSALALEGHLESGASARQLERGMPGREDKTFMRKSRMTGIGLLRNAANVSSKARDKDRCGSRRQRHLLVIIPYRQHGACRSLPRRRGQYPVSFLDVEAVLDRVSWNEGKPIEVDDIVKSQQIVVHQKRPLPSAHRHD